MHAAIRFVAAVAVVGLVDAVSHWPWPVEFVLSTLLLTALAAGLVDRRALPGNGTLTSPTVDQPVVHEYVSPKRN